MADSRSSSGDGLDRDTRLHVDLEVTRQEQLLGLFVEFHLAHPEFWAAFDKFACQVRDAGFSRYGGNAILERCRWHLTIEERSDGFKVNQNFIAFYTRLWLLAHPESPDFFELRVQRSAHRRARTTEPGPDEQASLLDLIADGDPVVARLRMLLGGS